MPTILVVDDVSANRDFLATLLRYDGHRVLEAPNGHAALVAVREERPDLIITDILMPVMDGYELFRQLRLVPATGDIPVVFWTAHYGEREAKELALASGVAHVLPKPVEPEEVLRIVGLMLSGAPGIAPETVAAPLGPEFDRDHLRLLTNKLSETRDDLKAANARLRALINIGLELASERNPSRLPGRVCVAARDLFGATYVTLGLIDRSSGIVRQFFTCGVGAAIDVSLPNWIVPGDAVPGILATVVEERRTIRGFNAGGRPAGLGLPPLHAPIHNFVAAPLASPSHVYGWLCLVGNEGREFTAEDEQLAMAKAAQVGRIYENAYYASVVQERAEDLKQERDRAQRYLDTAETILLALDLEGRITLVNRYACNLLGRPATELIGQKWIEICLPERVRPEVGKYFDTLLEGDTSIRENPIISNSGEERLIEWRNTLLRDTARRVIGTFSSGTDITERHRALEALTTAEERIRFVLESANIGIWDMNYTTGVLQWSETLEAHYGLKAGTFEGTFEAFIELVHPHDRASLLETVGAAMSAGSDFWLQNRAMWADGTVRWLNGAGRILLNEQGEAERGVGISIDVTEQRLLQDQYQQAQKMEAVGRLAGGVAHDFNNLLTVILGYCDLSLAELVPGEPRHSDIAEIRKAGERAAALTRQLLAFSRKQVIEPTTLDLNLIVGEIRPMLERLIGEDLVVILDLDPQLGTVQADRGQVEQVVVNLVVNARDSMPEGGKLTIGTANVELDEHYVATHRQVAPGLYVALTITDTGTGMSPQIQARLFEPFFTTKEPGKGTGLGLSTVQGIVARSAGSVGVYSEVGLGTSVTVYLPRTSAGGAIPEAPRSVSAHAGTQTILVVEDSPGLRQLTKRLLERQGYTVLLAGHASEAMELFNRHQSAIDVLLTDVIMPGGSGPELSDRLRADKPDLKVIYMSGYTDEVITHHGVLKSGIAFLHKPFTSETLGRKLRDVLDG
ncbi:MAG TPA: response regulator [Vicinamibacterales bacterium]|nr:response regulator [Vicinamibacterales bacterium]